MSKFPFFRSCLIVFTLLLSLVFRGFSQSNEDLNLLLENLLKKDFRQIQEIKADSISIEHLIVNANRCVKNRNDSAYSYAFQAVFQAEKAGLFYKIPDALEILGEYSMSKENFTEATSRYLQALKLEEKLGDQKRMADFYDLLWSVYFYQEIFPKALEYNQQALKIYQNLKDTINIAKVLDHLGSLYNSRQYCEKRTSDETKADFELALNYYQQSLNLLEKKNYKEGIVNAWSNIGNQYRRMGELDKALYYVQKAVDYYKQTNNFERLPATTRMLGLIYSRNQQYDLALEWLLESQKIGEREKRTDGIQFLYEDIARTYECQGDYKNSLIYYKKYMILRDSIYNNEKSKQIFELETKYQAEKKQSEIKRLILVKKQRTLVIYILVASLFLVTLFSYTFFRNIRNKKIIADQKLEIKEKQLLELEKERQLTAAKSVLQGEEAERSRLAGDLHDGLGGMLTGVKLKLSSMKENSIITSENLANFNHALDLLDTSITEMRRVAHNLMPETLMHYGLKTALTDFIKQVSPNEPPKITLSTFGEDLRYVKELEITVYRITQELATNALKHAQADQIDIQVFTETDRVCVQVIDNGIGFETGNLDSTKNGKGLKNIQDRVTAFNGRFEILSEPAKGTETTLEFLIS
jgi:signal transduction histidine kinase